MAKLKLNEGFGSLQLYAMIAVVVIIAGLATTVYIMSLRNKVLKVEIENLNVQVVAERSSKDNALKIIEKSNKERVKEVEALKKSVAHYRSLYEDCVLGGVTECKVVKVEGCPTFRIEEEINDPFFRKLKNMWYGGAP